MNITTNCKKDSQDHRDNALLPTILCIMICLLSVFVKAQELTWKPKGFTITEQMNPANPDEIITIPPSWSSALRDTIAEPAQAMVIWNTTLKKAQYYDGKSWKFFKTNQHYIGEQFGGGIVFYTDEGFEHGMVMATEDLLVKVKWGEQDSVVNSVAKKIGSGKSNTEKIVLKLGEAENAARLCSDLTKNGYSDWYLPSIDELMQILQNLHLFKAGNLKEDQYWSSSETDFNNAWMVDFKYYVSSEKNYKNILFVRPVRSF